MAGSDNRLTFQSGEPQRVIAAQTWIISAMVVLLVLAVAAIATLRRSPDRTGAVQNPDAYAANLQIADVTMTEATNGTGGKSTYVDGTIRNTGSRTLTSALVQVTFATSDGSAPYRETVPLALIRTREPYVDLQPLYAVPLTPGQSREFRLIFEAVPASWNVKPPEMHVVQAELK